MVLLPYAFIGLCEVEGNKDLSGEELVPKNIGPIHEIVHSLISNLFLVIVLEPTKIKTLQTKE